MTKVDLLTMAARIDMALLRKEAELEANPDIQLKRALLTVKTKAESFRRKIVRIKTDPVSIENLRPTFVRHKKEILAEINNIRVSR